MALKEQLIELLREAGVIVVPTSTSTVKKTKETDLPPVSASSPSNRPSSHHPSTSTAETAAAATAAAREQERSQHQQLHQHKNSNVLLEFDDSKEQLVRLMEVWIGLQQQQQDDSDNNNEDDDAGTEIPYIEDSSPLSNATVVKLCHLLQLAYSGKDDHNATTATRMRTPSNNSEEEEEDDSSSTNTPLFLQNLLIESNLPPAQISLEQVFVPVKVTKWFRHLLELTVDPSQSLCQRLLSLNPPLYSNSLVQAIYHHIQDLPRLQAQMHRYTVKLQQQSSTSQSTPSSQQTSSSSQSTTTVVHDPTTRLAQYATASAVSQRLLSEWKDHLQRLKAIIGELYQCASPHQRATQRKHLGRVWTQYLLEQQQTSTTTTGSSASSLRHENTSAAGIALTLSLLHRILLGTVVVASSSSSSASTTATRTTLPASYTHLLTAFLIPLHKPNQLVLWRDQTPVLELYHEQLTQCIAVLLQQQPELLSTVMLGLTSDTETIFPLAGNTPKQVLLIHELDSYLSLYKNHTNDPQLEHALMTAITDGDGDNSSSSSWWWTSLLRALARCMGSDHSRVAERALEMFQNKVFVHLVQTHFEHSLSILLPCLIKKEVSWNPTVRKRTYFVLKQLSTMNETVFAQVCNKLFGDVGSDKQRISNDPSSSSVSRLHDSPLFQTESSSTSVAPSVPKDLSLKAGMGSWRPPSSSSSLTTGRHRPPPQPQHHPGMPPPSAPPSARTSSQPPSTVTGVAPWATTATTSRSRSNLQPPVTVTGVAPWAVPSPSTASSTPPAPPVTITGVAPWALGTASSSKSTSTVPHKRRAHDAHIGATTPAAETPSLSTNNATNNTAIVAMTGLDHVLAYMKLLEPPETEGDGTSSWSKAQMSESPTLLPDLKFHDLVFGHDLGTGAFGCVRYARLIDRNKTRSYWAEYAVKIISTDKIRELGYEASVQREIAVLRILSHPGIARLVSSFRFREGAYLVLEYASGGDLHQLLRKHGSLDHDSTRFVMGEVVAALSSIHDLGLVYSDLKTENILITETGHIKLTDMGACRPVTAQAKDIIRSISKDLLKNLRDGDWRPQKHRHGNSMEDDSILEVEEKEDEDEDDRIEGTISYLPPEVVLGGVPTYAADSWALGCVTFQCLSGRPPFLEFDEEATRQRIVSFNDDSRESSNPLDALFEDKHASSIEPSARDMIEALLQRHPSSRPTMQQVAEHRFFTEANVDVFSLHRQAAYPLDVGKVAPTPNAQWSRRQYSSIWAPQPVAYDFSLPDESRSKNDQSFGAISVTSPIPEGDEGPAFFSATTTTSTSSMTAGTSRVPPKTIDKHHKSNKLFQIQENE